MRYLGTPLGWAVVGSFLLGVNVMTGYEAITWVAYGTLTYAVVGTIYFQIKKYLP